jgi:multiple sugar transport system substrate-binding protein/putative aldouronate transport system substrate-binding protein
MKKMKASKIMSLLLVVIMLFSLVGCKKESTDSNGDTKESPSATTNADGTKTYDKFITVDVFANEANYQGMQTGWFADVVKKKFNMELNIIAPNVAGGGDTLFQTRSAAGDLGDLVIIGSENDRLKNVVAAGLLLDMSDMMKTRTNVSKYNLAIEKAQGLSGKDGIYAIPKSVSSQPATNPSESGEPTFGNYLRYDIYQQIGSPEIKTLEDLLPVLKQMQEANPKSDSGAKTYAVSLFKDWDGNMLNNAKQPTCYYGYDEIGFVLSKADGSDDQSIIDTNSQYVRALNFFFQANQMGILDPDSPTQNFDTLSNKYKDGAVLFSFWPWLGQSLYNSEANTKAGKGFMLVPIKDQQIFSYGANPTGTSVVMGIGSKAEDPERLMDFIDWMYSPEGIQILSGAGIKGLTWDVGEDGKPYLTEFGFKAQYDQNTDVQVPEDFGGGTYREGVSALNFTPVLGSDTDPTTNSPYSYALWDTVIAARATNLQKSWQEAYGAQDTFTYLKENNQLLVAPGTNFVGTAQSSDIEALRNQCKAVIVDYSWKMVFAKDEAEFKSLLKDMQDTVIGLGYNDVLDFDLKCAKDQTAARKAAAETN